MFQNYHSCVVDKGSSICLLQSPSFRPVSLQRLQQSELLHWPCLLPGSGSILAHTATSLHSNSSSYCLNPGAASEGRDPSSEAKLRNNCHGIHLEYCKKLPRTSVPHRTLKTHRVHPLYPTNVTMWVGSSLYPLCHTHPLAIQQWK